MMQPGVNPYRRFSASSVSFVSRDHETNNNNNSIILGDNEVFNSLRRVETGIFPARVECRSKSNCQTDTRTYHFEEEDRIMSLVSPCQSGLDVEGTESIRTYGSLKQKEQLQTADSTSVLEHKWSASSSTDSLKSISQDDENEEGRISLRKSAAIDESAAIFCQSFDSRQRQQQPGSPNIGLHSDSSWSFDSSGQEEEEKHHAAVFPGTSKVLDNCGVRFDGLTGFTRKKWNSSDMSLDGVDSEEEEEDNNYQFPPLIEAVRVKEPSSFAAAHRSCGEASPVSSSSSSIGNRSDDSSGSVISDADCPGDLEVESSFRSGSLNQLNLSSLESSLPIRRGLSRFWNGKAKSFASLQDVSSLASLADLAKPENPYSRRRRISSSFRPSSPLTRPNTAGISKKPPSGTGKSSLVIAVTMGNKLENGPKNLSPRSALRNAQRSFSLSDLEQHGCRTDRAPPPATMTRMRS